MYCGRPIDDSETITPDKVDFSDESVTEAYQFVIDSINTVIDTLKREKEWLREMSDEQNTNLGMVVIALANQYCEAPGFQNRWNLREKK